ncbi:MAG: ParA family protein [Kineosporiaceae bacterium]
MLVISICSLKGGVGKTSVTLGLASAALARGIRTLVVDMDPQADATTGLDVTALRDASVADVLRGTRRRVLDAATAPSGWAQDQPGQLDVVVGSPDTAALDGPATAQRAHGRLAAALARADDYRLVLIDCPPSLGALTRTALVASTRAVIVTEPALFSVSAADRALRAIEEVRQDVAPDLQPLGVVVNRYRERSPEHRYRVQELSEMFGPLVLTPAIPERSALQQAQGASRPLHEWPGPAAQELSHLFDQHLARILRAPRPARRADTPAQADTGPAALRDQPSGQPPAQAAPPSNGARASQSSTTAESGSGPAEADSGEGQPVAR